jgi:hypothetical protein
MTCSQYFLSDSPIKAGASTVAENAFEAKKGQQYRMSQVCMYTMQIDIGGLNFAPFCAAELIF